VRAIDVDTARSSFIIDQAVAALRTGDPAEAERLLRHRSLQAPTDVAALAKLADIVVEQGRIVEAALLLRRILAVAPAHHGIRLSLARLHQQLAEFAVALAELEALPGAIRESFEVTALEAALLGQIGRHDQELALYELLVEREPANASLWMSYGNALKTVGRTGEAVAAMRAAIKARPTYGEAYWSLANLKTVRFDDGDIAAMRKALRSKLDPIDALHFNFALGKALEDRRRFADSFRHYAAGNRIRHADIPPAFLTVTPRVEVVVQTLTADLFDRCEGAGDPTPDPIFIVGLQRSGSTLVEQILASHPHIEGTAELLAMEQIWARVGGMGPSGNPFLEVTRLQADALRGLGAEYLDRVRPFRSTDRPFFVDKLPANWLNAGFIRLILPNAKIIDARRHPMACGFSNFKQHYASGVTFAYDLRSIGIFYRDYVRMMDHIDMVQPGSVHRLVNERLIDDPEGEVRRLLDYLGLPFDSACLDFHRNRRAVNTPSAEQVRRPLNRDGVDSWRPYEPWLAPLAEALGPALEHWDATRPVVGCSGAAY